MIWKKSHTFIIATQMQVMCALDASTAENSKNSNQQSTAYCLKINRRYNQRNGLFLLNLALEMETKEIYYKKKKLNAVKLQRMWENEKNLWVLQSKKPYWYPENSTKQKFSKHKMHNSQLTMAELAIQLHDSVCSSNSRRNCMHWW